MKKIVMLLLAMALSMSIMAEEVLFGFRLVPPYVMKSADGVYSGIEYEIIKESLAAKGHTLKPVDFPFARLISTVTAKGVQGAAPILPSHNTGAFLSNSYITYNNVAMGLAKSNLTIKTIQDLKGLGVIAFQTAGAVLGPDFAAVVAGNSKYVESADQITQIRTLFAGRVDVAIGEARILNWFVKDPNTGVDSSMPTQQFRIFNPTTYRAAFWNERIASDFNAGLEIIKANGVYDKILLKYTK